MDTILAIERIIDEDGFITCNDFLKLILKEIERNISISAFNGVPTAFATNKSFWCNQFTESFPGLKYIETRDIIKKR